MTNSEIVMVAERAVPQGVNELRGDLGGKLISLRDSRRGNSRLEEFGLES